MPSSPLVNFSGFSPVLSSRVSMEASPACWPISGSCYNSFFNPGNTLHTHLNHSGKYAYHPFQNSVTLYFTNIAYINVNTHTHNTYIFITKTQNLVTVTTGCGISQKDSKGHSKIRLREQPNKNMGFTYLQIERKPWLEGYHPQIPILTALCAQLQLLKPPEKYSWVRHWVVGLVC
jgi:hypothetical protein